MKIEINLNQFIRSAWFLYTLSVLVFVLALLMANVPSFIIFLVLGVFIFLAAIVKGLG